MRRTIFALAFATAFVSLLPAQQKRIYIANDDHTDYMWAHNENEYRQAFLQMIDFYLNLADQTAGNKEPFRSRFNTDGTFWVRVYKKNRSTADFDRLIQKIKDGSIGVPLTLLNLCYGAMPAEAVLRSMYYAGQLERRYNFRLKLATSQENQTLPFGLGTLWAGAGALFSWKGICGCASRVPDAWDRANDMYWWKGRDGSRILMKWNSMIRHNPYDIGGYAEARVLPGVIDFVSTNSTFRARHPYDVIGVFGYGGDDLKTMTNRFVQAAKSSTNTDRRVIVSNIVDFFEDFAQTYGSELPTRAVSFGNEWDLLSASMSEVSGRVKRTTEKLRTAEAMAALVSLQDASFMSGRENERESAWIDLGLFYEHDWTADGSIARGTRAAWQRARASGIESYVNTLHDDAQAALGGMIKKNTVHNRYFVFNSLGWPRTGEADLPYTGSTAVHVVDVSTGTEVPFQGVTIDGRKYLRIWAENVPSVGYKTFDVIPGRTTTWGGGPTVSGDTIKNSYYRIQVGTNGSIVSLTDKRRGGREMVRNVNGRLWNDFGPGSGMIYAENVGPVSATLRIRAVSPLLHETRITLFRDSPRIEIKNQILQNFGAIRTWGFGFNLDLPRLWHEEVGAVIQARLSTEGGHYSPRSARYDWLSLNHFADISESTVGVTLSSPDLSFMRLGNSSTTSLDVQTPQISVLAGGQVDGSGLGIPKQGGDTYFLQRFALETHDAFDAAAAMRFALEHQNPLAAGEVTGGTKYPGALFSLFGCSSPNVFVWSVKPAEDTSQGAIIIRLWNQTQGTASFALTFNRYDILAARRTSLIETIISSVPFQSDQVQGMIPGFGWRTYYLKLSEVLN